MSIIDSLDQLTSLLENAKNVPLTNTVILNRETLEDMVEAIKNNYPREIKQGQTILLERKEILEAARTEALRIIQETAEQQQTLVEEETILRLANEKARLLKEETSQQCIRLFQQLNNTLQLILKNAEEEQKKNRQYLQQSYQQILDAMKKFKNEKIDAL